MDDFDNTEFAAVSARLKIEVNSIVDRHRCAGDPLTWRLMHEIEDEAFQRVQLAGDLNKSYIRMMKSSALLQYPRTDELVDFGKSDALPAAFFMIQRAYSQVH